MSPGVVQHRIAEHFHQSLVLQDYQKILRTPLRELGQTGVVALILSAFLLNVIAFALSESETAGSSDPTTSWVFSSDENRLGWLSLQIGIKALLLSTATYLKHAMQTIGPVFFGHGRTSWGPSSWGDSLDVVPQAWIRMFSLDAMDTRSDCCIPASEDSSVEVSFDGVFKISSTTGLSEIFRPPVAMLAALLNVEPVSENVFKHMKLLSKLQEGFRGLLYDKDERALWLFAYWLGLMCRFEGIWWTDGRVKRDYKAICMWLERLRLAERPGNEGVMWAEMMEELRMAPVFVSI